MNFSGQAAVRFQPEVGWQVSHATCDNYEPRFCEVNTIFGFDINDTSPGRYTFNGWVRIPIDPDVSFTVTGVMVEKPKLTWTMECEDGSVPPAAIGWVTVGDDDNSLPAQNYYTAATPYNQWDNDGQNYFDGPNQLIKLTAYTHHGYEFVRWTGEGDIYDSNGIPITEFSLEATDEEPEKWVTSESIWIKMAEKNTSMLKSNWG